MCKTHYAKWRRTYPEKISTRVNEQTVLDAMPGTILKIMADTGLCREAVKRALRVLNVAGPERQAFVKDHQAPATQGQRWLEIWESGNGKNMRLTKERKIANSKALVKAADARRRPPKNPRTQRASWAAALMMGVQECQE